MADRFTFFESYFRSIETLPDDLQLQLYRAICEIAFNGHHVDLPYPANAIFAVMEPSIVKSAKIIAGGSKGGSAPKPKAEQKTEQALQAPLISPLDKPPLQAPLLTTKTKTRRDLDNGGGGGKDGDPDGDLDGDPDNDNGGGSGRDGDPDTNTGNDGEHNPTTTTNDDGRDELVRYARNTLNLSQGNVDELNQYRNEYPDDLIRYAIDDATSNGKSSWSYVKAILARYQRDGLTSVEAVKAKEENRNRFKNFEYNEPEIRWFDRDD